MRQRQPDTDPAKAAGEGPIHLMKEFKNLLVMFRGDAYPRVSHRNGHLFPVSSEGSIDAHLSDFCELCRVREQIPQDEQEFCRVGPHREQLRTDLPNESDGLATEQKAHHLCYLFPELGQTNLLGGHPTRSGLNLDKVQEIVDEVSQQARLSADALNSPTGLLRERSGEVAQEQVAVTNNDMQGSPQLVRNIGEQLLLHLLQFPHFLELRGGLQGHIDP